MERGDAVSGAAFEGLEGLAQQGPAESYEPGTQNSAPGLVNAVMELFESGLFERTLADYDNLAHGNRSAYWRRLKPLSEVMASYGNPEDADEFLDEVISRIAFTSQLDDHPYLGSFLDPLVQVLYDRGHNDFHLDLRVLQAENGSDTVNIGFNLKGKKSRRLRASYTADAHVFARGCINCELDLYGGCNNTDLARDSILRFHGAVKDVGSMDKGSVFYLSSSTPIGVTSLSADNEFHVMLEEKPRLMHWLKSRALRSDIAHLGELGFWERGNRLYLHEGGSVREYAP